MSATSGFEPLSAEDEQLLLQLFPSDVMQGPTMNNSNTKTSTHNCHIKERLIIFAVLFVLLTVGIDFLWSKKYSGKTPPPAIGLIKIVLWLIASVVTEQIIKHYS